MKKIIFSLLAIASLCSLNSCKMDEPAAVADDNTITAVAPMAKTSIGENGTDVLWTAGNKISLVLNNGEYAAPTTYAYTLVSGAGSKTATFSGSLTTDQIKEKGAFAFYPSVAVKTCHLQKSDYKKYGSAYLRFGSKDNQFTSSSVKLDRQKYSATSPVADNSLPMWAEIPEGQVNPQFRHLCGIIKFVFDSKGNQKTIGTVSIKANTTDTNPETGEINNNPLPVAFCASNTTGAAEYLVSNTIGASSSEFFDYQDGQIAVTGCGDTSYSTNYVKTVYMIVPPLDGYYDLGYNGNVQFKNKYLKVEAGRIRTINVEMK